MNFCRSLLSVLLVTGAALSSSERDAWLTEYEKSGFVATGVYEETVSLCRRLDEASDRIQFLSLGRSPEGREIPLLTCNMDTVPPRSPVVDGPPTVLIVAGIHAGEIDGKDAGLMLIRDAFIHGDHPGLFDPVRVMFVPIFNVDGHERRSRTSRINQRGPVETGWRTTAQNINLNRDWLKADTPEMRSLLRAIHTYGPDLLIDIHTTDGADYQYTITYSLNDQANVPDDLRWYLRGRFLPEVKQRMKAAGYDFVPQVFLRDYADPMKGWEYPVFPPRLSTGYGTVINRPSLLIENHSLKSYRERVNATYACLKVVLQTIAAQSEPLALANQQADQAAATLPGEWYPLNWELANDSTLMELKGVTFRKAWSPISGDSVIRWENIPHTYRVPFFETAQAQDSVQVPYAYLIPQAWLPLLEPTLNAHSVRVHRLLEPVTLTTERYRLSEAMFAPRPYEGRQRVANFRLSMFTEQHLWPAGTGVVPVRDPLSQVIVHLLEPNGPDSFVRWGFLNQIFEQKEYFEAYTLDTVAMRMMQETPALAQEFQRRLASDSAFASDPNARLEFFYERSPFWDERKDLYPVARLVDQRATNEVLVPAFLKPE